MPLTRIIVSLVLVAAGAAPRVAAEPPRPSELPSELSSELIDQYFLAREADPVFRAAIDERRIADATLREARAGSRPDLRAGAELSQSWQNIRQSDNFLFAEGKTDYGGQRLSLSLTQPVYRAEVLGRIDQARGEVRQAEYTFVARDQDLMVRVAEAYFGVLSAEDDLDLAVAERIALGVQSAEAEGRFTAGVAAATDVHDARARLALAEATESAAKAALLDRRQALAELTGQVPARLAGVSETLVLTPPEDPDPEAWVKRAIFQNPEIRAAEAAIEVARLERRVQNGARLPSLDLVGSYVRNDSGGSLFTAGGGGSDISTGDVMLRLAVPVYDGGRTSARVSAASLRESKARSDAEGQRRRVERQTRASFEGVMSAITRVEALERSVFSNEAALALKEEGLQAGLNTVRQVLDVRKDLFQARRDLAQARYQYLMNTLQLKRSTGVLDVGDLEEVNALLVR